MLKKEFRRNDVEEDFERLNCFSHKENWCSSIEAVKPLQLILGNTVQPRDCQVTSKGVRDLSCYHAGLYTQIFVNHFPPSMLSVIIIFFYFYLLISAQPLQHFPPSTIISIIVVLWVKCTLILTKFWHSFHWLLYYQWKQIDIGTFFYRYQVHRQTWLMQILGFLQKLFCFAGQIFWHSNLSSMGHVTEYSGYIVGRCSCGTCWGCHFLEPFSLHVCQTLQCLFDSNKSPAQDF